MDLWKRHAWFRIGSLISVGSTLYIAAWILFFIARVFVVMEKNRDEYSGHEYQHLLCEANSTTRKGFSKVCDEAENRVRITLWRESLYKTWENSTLCGGSTCFATIFGADETVSMLILRTTALLCVIAILLYCTYVVIRKFDACFGNRKLETERAFQKHDEFMQRKRKSQHESSLALATSSQLLSLPTLRNRTSPLIVEATSPDNEV